MGREVSIEFSAAFYGMCLVAYVWQILLDCFDFQNVLKPSPFGDADLDGHNRRVKELDVRHHVLESSDAL